MTPTPHDRDRHAAEIERLMAPGLTRVAERKLMELQAEGWKINGHALWRDGDRALLDCAGYVAWVGPEAAASIDPENALRAEVEKPIDMILHCPACGMQHIDKAEEPAVFVGITQTSWANPPHKSHLCQLEDGGCGHIWRPADVPTNGVRAIKTKGEADSPAVTPSRHPPSQAAAS